MQYCYSEVEGGSSNDNLLDLGKLQLSADEVAREVSFVVMEGEGSLGEKE